VKTILVASTKQFMYKSKPNFNAIALCFAFLLILTAFIAAFLPSEALAATTHHYVCADFTTGGDVTCVSDVLDSASNGSAYDAGGTALDLATSPLWYLSGTFVGDGTFEIHCTDDVGNTSCTSLYPSGTSVYTDEPFPISNSPTYSGLYLQGHGSGWTASEICITDTPGDCGGTPPTPTPPATSTTPCESVSSTTQCTLIFNPNQDYFNGLALFLYGFTIILWLFKGRK